MNLRSTRIPSSNDDFALSLTDITKPFYEGFVVVITGADTSSGDNVATVSLSYTYEFTP